MGVTLPVWWEREPNHPHNEAGPMSEEVRIQPSAPPGTCNVNMRFLGLGPFRLRKDGIGGFWGASMPRRDELLDLLARRALRAVLLAMLATALRALCLVRVLVPAVRSVCLRLSQWLHSCLMPL